MKTPLTPLQKKVKLDSIFYNYPNDEAKQKAFAIAEGLTLEDWEEYKIPSEILEILKNPNLFNLIIHEFDKKLEGELPTKKAIFLSLCSIWVKNSEVPLNTLVSAESSAGKSFLCKNILKIFPKNLYEYRTKITPEAFTYWKNGEDSWTWDGKICYLEDVSQSILDAPTFKVMCSEGSTATIVIKQKAVDIEIQGKPCILITTARTNPNTEILNRFQIVSLNETSQQTKAIVFRIARQKIKEPYNQKVTESFLFLRRREVFIPFAERIAEFLDENYNFESLRLRRDFSRLLDLIRCSAVLHQFQREKNEFGDILANEQDYQIAREVINYIQTQTFRGLTHQLKKAFDCCQNLRQFTAREIYSKFPFVNQKMWYLYLDKLLERGMLKTELVRTEEAKQKVTYYSLNEDKSFSLPDFSLLPINITNDTLVTNDTIVTKLTNDSEKDRTIVTNVTNIIEKAKEIDFSELDKEDCANSKEIKKDG